MTNVDVNQLAEHYIEHGYAVWPAAIGADELAALRREATTQIDAGPREPASDFGHALTGEGIAVQYRVDSVGRRAIVNGSVFAAMRHPAVVSFTTALLETPVFGADALVFKKAAGGAIVPMHSAYVNPKVDRETWELGADVCNVGLYLDRATRDTGCLKIVPGTHRLSKPEVESLLTAGFDVPGVVDVELDPGDVLFHSEYVVHGSLPTPPDHPQRRVLYLAFARLAAFDADTRARRVGLLGLMRWAAEHRSRLPYADGEGGSFVAPVGWLEEVDALGVDELKELVGSAFDLARSATP